MPIEILRLGDRYNNMTPLIIYITKSKGGWNAKASIQIPQELQG